MKTIRSLLLLAASAALLQTASASPMATGTGYDIGNPGLLSSTDNLLAGLTPTFTDSDHSWYNAGNYWETQTSDFGCVTDSQIPDVGNEDATARALIPKDASLTWTWDTPSALDFIRIYTRWSDGYRTDVSVQLIEVLVDDTWTPLENSSFCYARRESRNTIPTYNHDFSRRVVTFEDSEGEVLATGVTGLRITFGDQSPTDNSGDNDTLCYGCYWEIEAKRGVDPSTLAFQTFGDCAVVNGLAASDGNSAVISFSESGRIRFTKPMTLDVLVVGGGGGGGNGGFAGGGGGGAGGVIYQQQVFLPAGEYPVVVGVGGSENGKGSDSVFAGYRAYGGGAGYHGYSDPTPTANGGSGGGAAAISNWSRTGGTGIDGQGHDGGNNLRIAILAANLESSVVKNYSGQDLNAGGGGGGAGAPGGTGTFTLGEYKDDNGTYTAFCSDWTPGSGGDGIACSITGEEVWYGGGGGGGQFGWYRYGTEAAGGKGGGGKGGSYNDWKYDGNPEHGSKRDGEDGINGTGGGGGGGGSNGDQNYSSNGGRGGNGIVIIRFTQTFSENSYKATGGNTVVKTEDLYMVHTFTEDGTFELPNSVYAELLVVGGGGGGGEGGYAGGGGGGAGGFVYHDRYALLAGTYEVRVGAGGAENQKGADSAFGGLVAYGGGAGYHGYGDPDPIASGASGGGAAGISSWQRTGGTGITGQGHDGGNNLAKTIIDESLATYAAKNGFGQDINAGGGGGGAGAPGGSGTASDFEEVDVGGGTMISRTDHYGPGVGGDGLPCSITGEEVWYAGGGGGGQFGWYKAGTEAAGGKGGGGKGGYFQDPNAIDAVDGVDGTGGGGGGGGSKGDSNNASHGGSGGSGIVIVRYKLRPAATTVLLR